MKRAAVMLKRRKRDSQDGSSRRSPRPLNLDSGILLMLIWGGWAALACFGILLLEGFFDLAFGKSYLRKTKSRHSGCFW